MCLLTNQYFDSISKKCINCQVWCLTCTSNTKCTSCDSLAFRTLLDYDCVPISGYYESYNASAGLCDANCLECKGSANNCTLCLSYIEALSNNKCIIC